MVGLVILTPDGQVATMDDLAGQMIRHYFPAQVQTGHLPDNLRRWVVRKIRTIEREIEAGSALISHSYEVKSGSRRLTVRLNPHPDEGFLLMLEETKVAEYSIAALMNLGLTRREAEVLFWIGKDKTSLEVAELLTMSERTVKKHLEHIYKKFRVQTRLAAVMYALEKLGIMDL